MVSSKVVNSKQERKEAQRFSQYFDWSENLNDIPLHRLLVILRAETEDFIKVNVDVDKEEIVSFIESNLIKSCYSSAEQISLAVQDAYKRFLEYSVANEILREAKVKADERTVRIFAKNLNQLFLASPLGEKRILAIDPGSRMGCKMVCFDEKGNFLHNETIYPYAP